MFHYLRVLKRISNKGISTMSSLALSDNSGINPNMVRKDLSYFGQFGRRGVGYNVDELTGSIRRILGLNTVHNVALCGIGNLGSALLSYKGFRDQGFKFVAAFDQDKRKIGKTYDDIEVLDSQHIVRESKKKNVEIAVITVTALSAQETVDMFIEAEVKTILNFAPTKISVPEGIKLKNVDLTSELVGLTHFLQSYEKITS